MSSNEHCNHFALSYTYLQEINSVEAVETKTSLLLIIRSTSPNQTSYKTDTKPNNWSKQKYDVLQIRNFFTLSTFK